MAWLAKSLEEASSLYKTEACLLGRRLLFCYEIEVHSIPSGYILCVYLQVQEKDSSPFD